MAATTERDDSVSRDEPVVTGEAAAAHDMRGRRIGAGVLLALAVVLLVAAVVAGWMRTQLLDTDVWVESSRESLADPAVSIAVSHYVVDQLWEYTQPQDLVADAAPPRLQPLVGPATGALREGAYTAAERAMTSPQMNDAWAAANQAAHERFVNVVEGEGEIVRETSEGIRLDVRPLLVAIAQRLGLSGERVARIPDSVALIEPRNSAELESTLETVRQLDRAAPLLAIAAFVALIASFFVAPPSSRRRFVFAWGVAIIIGGVVLGLLRGWAAEPVAEAITVQPSSQAAFVAIFQDFTDLLRLAANSMVLVGIVAVVGAWYVGPSRSAAAARDLSVPTWRRHPVAAWGVLALVTYVAFTQVPALESRQPIGIVLLLVLLAAGFEFMRRSALRLVPEDAPPGEARTALSSVRTRVTDSVTSSPASQPVEVPAAAVAASATASEGDGTSFIDRLERLDDLHRRGILDDDEFAAAKSHLIGTTKAGGPVAP